MAANTRIKVKRTTLLSRLQAAKAEAIAKYEADMSVWGQKIAAWRAEVDAAVKAFAGAWDPADEDLYEEHWGSSRQHPGYIKVDCPKRPDAPQLNTSKLDYMIRILEASEDEHISISADDDYARWL